MLVTFRMYGECGEEKKWRFARPSQTRLERTRPKSARGASGKRSRTGVGGSYTLRWVRPYLGDPALAVPVGSVPGTDPLSFSESDVCFRTLQPYPESFFSSLSSVGALESVFSCSDPHHHWIDVSELAVAGGECACASLLLSFLLLVFPHFLVPSRPPLLLLLAFLPLFGRPCPGRRRRRFTRLTQTDTAQEPEREREALTH